MSLNVSHPSPFREMLLCVLLRFMLLALFCSPVLQYFGLKDPAALKPVRGSSSSVGSSILELYCAVSGVELKSVQILDERYTASSTLRALLLYWCT